MPVRAVLSVLFCLPAAAAAAWDEPAARPNIVYIVSDDHGWADLGVQGCTDVPTPHLDALAQGGVRLTAGYVSCPVCSPTRAGLMTGRYQQRFGHEFNPGPAQAAAENFGLPLEEQTLPQLLHDAGYVCGGVGKWHLGYRPEFHPLERGFDEFFGFLGGAHNYFDAGRRRDLANPILRGREPVEEPAYLTDALGREAVDFVGRHREQPFFLYLAFNAIHTPLQADDARLEEFAEIADPRRRTMAAMLTALDDAVGGVLAALDEHGLAENTLVVFHADNGGPTPSNASRNEPLRGYKGQVYEGGIRVPFLVRWPAKLPAGQVYDRPVIALDVLPTALAAAGVEPPGERPLDGVDLVPFLAGEKEGDPHAALYWRFGRQAAVRSGDWKLVRTSDAAEWELYDLSQDVGESRDLAGEQPERAEELASVWKAWDAELAEPRWGSRGRRGK